MKPLSRRKRFVYLALFVALFCVSIPPVLLYASGYRMKGFSIVTTGGVYLAVPLSDAAVSLNGELIGTSSLFNKSFYIGDLEPGSYAVHVAREGYRAWYRTLSVESNRVTDARVFFAPEYPALVELDPKEKPDAASSSPRLSASALESYTDAFVKKTSAPLATTTLGTLLDADGNLELYLEGDGLVLHFASATSSAPSQFCASPSSCVRDIRIGKDGRERVTGAAFFKDGVVYQTKSGKIFLVEPDVRPSSILVPLYAHAGAEFRIVDGKLLIKDGTMLYEVSEW